MKDDLKPNDRRMREKVKQPSIRTVEPDSERVFRSFGNFRRTLGECNAIIAAEGGL